MTMSTGSSQQLPASLRPVLHRLLADYAGVSAGTVLGCLTGCHEELRRAGVRAGLTHAVDAMARTPTTTPSRDRPGIGATPSGRVTLSGRGDINTLPSRATGRARHVDHGR
jgi:hypothetical protein